LLMPKNRNKSTRTLSLESLEGRRLLIADLDITSNVTASVHEVKQASQISGFNAGTTTSTAVNVGVINGTRVMNGSLGAFDLADAVRFSVASDANVQLELSRLNRDADLFLTDKHGRVLARSTQGGTQVDSISMRLVAGEYFAVVTATSLRRTTYQLSILVTPQTTVPVTTTPVLTHPVNNTPSTPSPTLGNTVQTSPPASVVQPLADVAYFGGSREWNVNAVSAPEAWAAGYTGAGVLVAVIDSGVELTHPDLVQNLYVNAGEIPDNNIDDDGNGYVDDVQGYDFVENDNRPNDANGHGTHVAGTVAAARNSFGATGIAPNAKILPVRVLDADGSGDTSDVAAGIRYAAALGADIINLSLGGGYSRAIELAIDYARSLGSLVIAASGNESASIPSFPARFSASDSNVISVGAYTSSGSLARFSNDVGNSNSIQVDAPGSGIFSTYLGGSYATLSGTSMASPHVAGLAALILSSNPNLTSSQLRDLLTTGTIGRVTGSDSLGSASAKTSVAYAAAGFTTVTRSVTSNQNVQTLAQSTTVRATEAIDIGIASSPLPRGESSHSNSRVPVSDLKAIVPESKRFVSQPFLSTTNAQAHSHDTYFETYEAEKEKEFELESLLLRAFRIGV
jgi:subtilisin family serine protease